VGSGSDSWAGVGSVADMGWGGLWIRLMGSESDSWAGASSGSDLWVWIRLMGWSGLYSRLMGWSGLWIRLMGSGSDSWAGVGFG